MLGLLAGLGAGAHPLFGQPALTFESARELRTGVVFRGGCCLPRWWNGLGLVGAENNRSAEPLIYVVGGDGRREDVRLGLGDGSIIELYGVAGGADGALAVIGRATSSDSRRGPFLAWISPDRKQQTVTRLNPYFPGAVAIAADGSVWTAGLVNVNDNIPDHMIIRRFDKSGKMLAAFFPWKANPPRAHPAYGSYLVASSDRVGWYLPLFGNGYFEFSLEGRLLGRFRGARPADDLRYGITGAALSEDDELLVSRWDRQARKWELLSLDRAKRTWTPVQLPGEPVHGQSSRVLGFDGENLLTSVDIGVINYYKPQSPPGARQ